VIAVAAVCAASVFYGLGGTASGVSNSTGDTPPGPSVTSPTDPPCPDCLCLAEPPPPTVTEVGAAMPAGRDRAGQVLARPLVLLGQYERLTFVNATPARIQTDDSTKLFTDANTAGRLGITILVNPDRLEVKYVGPERFCRTPKLSVNGAEVTLTPDKVKFTEVVGGQRPSTTWEITVKLKENDGVQFVVLRRD
jgi:hypothetical protein